MKNPLKPIAVEFDDEYLWVTLADRRVIGTPLSDLIWLHKATPEQRNGYRLLAHSILWDGLDEAVDTEEMLRGYSIIQES